MSAIAEVMCMLQLRDIISISAPTDVWQNASCYERCPDILPVLVPSEFLCTVSPTPGSVFAKCCLPCSQIFTASWVGVHNGLPV